MYATRLQWGSFLYDTSFLLMLRRSFLHLDLSVCEGF